MNTHLLFDVAVSAALHEFSTLEALAVTLLADSDVGSLI